MKFCTKFLNISGETCLIHWCLKHVRRNTNCFEEKQSPIPRVYKTTRCIESASTVSFRHLTSKLPTSKNQVPSIFNVFCRKPKPYFVYINFYSTKKRCFKGLFAVNI